MINNDPIIVNDFMLLDDQSRLVKPDTGSMILYLAFKLKAIGHDVRWLEIVCENGPPHQHKYVLYDREEGFTGNGYFSGFLNDEEAIDFISGCNEEMDTEYESIEDFNKGDPDYEIVRNPFWKKERDSELVPNPFYDEEALKSVYFGKGGAISD